MTLLIQLAWPIMPISFLPRTERGLWDISRRIYGSDPEAGEEQTVSLVKRSWR